MIKKFKIKKELAFEILAIVLIIIYAISITPKTMQNDTYYTVSIGKLITENGIDFKDHFSWHENLPYTYPHWLYDVMMYFVYNLGGWLGIYLSTCFFASILGICIYKANSKLTQNKVISFLVTIGSLYLLQAYITARAQLVTFILFILLVYNIEAFLKNKKIKNAIGLIIIHILIANLHIAVWPFAFVLYMPYIAEYLISELVEIVLYKKISLFFLKRKIKKLEKSGKEELVEKRKLEQEVKEQKVERIKLKREENLQNPYKIKIEKNKNVRWLIVIMLIALLTGFCTPLGYEPFTYTIHQLQGNQLKFINEHLPMTLVENTKILSTLVIILGFMIFTKVKIRLPDLFMLAGLTYLMLSSRRQSSMFALIGTIAFSRILIDMIFIYTGKTYIEIMKSYVNWFTCFVISSLILIMSINMFKKYMDTPFVSESTYPVQASDWILENLDVKEIKLYNEYNFGSYLLYRGIPVFVDSRSDLYAPEFNTTTGKKEDGKDIFSDFINSSNIGTYYGRIFEKYNVSHILIKSNSKMNLIIKNADAEKFKQLYSDKNFVLYEVLEY